MKPERELEERDRNPDPITGEPGSHPVGVGLGTTGGAVAGAALGAVAGPVGAVAGAVVGGIAGAAAGKAVAESIDPTVEDAYWSENHARQEWADSSLSYDDYRPAYRLGWEGAGRRPGARYDDAEPELEARWESAKGTSRLQWDRAKHAARAGWHRIERRLPGDADGDGI
jgi:hypothetical protein